MRSLQFHVEALDTLLRKKKIATLAELMAALGTSARRTVFRKLNELNYRTSYSHRGRYYTLDRLAKFDALGLWSYGDVWFSIHGTLLSTAAALVENADSGYFVEELDTVLACRHQRCAAQTHRGLSSEANPAWRSVSLLRGRRRPQTSAAFIAPGSARRTWRRGRIARCVHHARRVEGSHHPVLQPARREAATAVRRA